MIDDFLILQNEFFINLSIRKANFYKVLLIAVNNNLNNEVKL